MIWFLPGFLGRAADWDTHARALAPASGGIARAIELFADAAPEIALPAWGEAWAARVKREDAAPVLVGYSLGGRLALHALLAAPDAWRAAILISAHTGLETEAERDARRAADEAWAARFETEPWAPLLRAWHEQPVFAGRTTAPPRDERDHDRAALAAALRTWSLGRQENLLPRLSSVTCPVLWLAGTGDVKFTRIGRRAVDRLAAGELAVLDGCAHRVPWEAPDAFLHRCREFLGRH